MCYSLGGIGIGSAAAAICFVYHSIAFSCVCEVYKQMLHAQFVHCIDDAIQLGAESCPPPCVLADRMLSL